MVPPPVPCRAGAMAKPLMVALSSELAADERARPRDGTLLSPGLVSVIFLRTWALRPDMLGDELLLLLQQPAVVIVSRRASSYECCGSAGLLAKERCPLSFVARAY